MEEVLKMQMEDYLRSKNVIPKEHHGARRKHNTMTAKINIDENINSMRNNQKNVVALSTDLTTAYDTVDHSLLLIKLEHVGLRGLALKLLTNYLMDRQIYTEVQGAYSKLSMMPNNSVVQGSKLSVFCLRLCPRQEKCTPTLHVITRQNGFEEKLLS